MSRTESRYTYPGTDVLRNHFRIQSARRLAHVEATFAQLALARLAEHPVGGSFDLFHLTQVHHAIFRDVYPFAGEVRTEDIAKGNTVFTPYEIIVPLSAHVFGALHQANNLRGMNASEFALNAANVMLSINALHPFREGNGRAQREFIRTLGLNAGYRIDWSRLDGDLLLRATIRSSADVKDLSLHTQVDRALANRQPDGALQQAFDRLVKARELGARR